MCFIFFKFAAACMHAPLFLEMFDLPWLSKLCSLSHSEIVLTPAKTIKKSFYQISEYNRVRNPYSTNIKTITNCACCRLYCWGLITTTVTHQFVPHLTADIHLLTWLNIIFHKGFVSQQHGSTLVICIYPGGKTL